MDTVTSPLSCTLALPIRATKCYMNLIMGSYFMSIIFTNLCTLNGTNSRFDTANVCTVCKPSNTL